MASRNEIKAEEREALRLKIYRLVGPRGEAEIVMERQALGAVIVRTRTTTTEIPEKDFASFGEALKYVASLVSDLVEEGNV